MQYANGRRLVWLSLFLCYLCLKCGKYMVNKLDLDLWL